MQGTDPPCQRSIAFAANYRFGARSEREKVVNRGYASVVARTNIPVPDGPSQSGPGACRDVSCFPPVL